MAVDSLGWTAELRIPFSQLRFSHAAEQVWGVRFVRWIQRKQEFDMFPFVGKTETGVASRFAHLLGGEAVERRHRLVRDERFHEIQLRRLNDTELSQWLSGVLGGETSPELFARPWGTG